MIGRKSPGNRRGIKKKVSKPRLLQFWEDHDSSHRSEKYPRGKRRSKKREIESEIGKRPFFDQLRAKIREPVAVSPSTLGAVRTFESRDKLSRFLNKVRTANRYFSVHPHDYFEFVPSQILSVDKRKLRVVERVQRGVSMLDIGKWSKHSDNKVPAKVSLYGEVLLRRLKNKKVSMRQFIEAVENAQHEFFQIREEAFEEGISIGDAHLSNLIVVDYNVKTKKIVLMMIDHGWDIQSTRDNPLALY